MNLITIIKVQDMMASNLADEFDESGLTAEEMELAQELLRQKLEEAEKGNLHLIPTLLCNNYFYWLMKQ